MRAWILGAALAALATTPTFADETPFDSLTFQSFGKEGSTLTVSKDGHYRLVRAGGAVEGRLDPASLGSLQASFDPAVLARRGGHALQGKGDAFTLKAQADGRLYRVSGFTGSADLGALGPLLASLEKERAAIGPATETLAAPAKLPDELHFSIGGKVKDLWRDVTIRPDGTVEIVSYAGSTQTQEVKHTLTGKLSPEEAAAVSRALESARLDTLPAELASSPGAAKPDLPAANPAVARIEADLAKAPDGLSKAATARFMQALAQAADELTALDWIATLPQESGHVGDLISGAHTVVSDQGALYDKLRTLPSAVERMSSHASLGPQYEIPGPTSGPILFGKTVDGTATWFQLEGYRAELTLKEIPDLVPHMWDFVKYKLTGRNQSRFGSSADTESHALYISPDDQRFWLSASEGGKTLTTSGAVGSYGEFGRIATLVDSLEGVASRTALEQAPPPAREGGILGAVRDGILDAFGRKEPVRTDGLSGLLESRIGEADRTDASER